MRATANDLQSFVFPISRDSNHLIWALKCMIALTLHYYADVPKTIQPRRQPLDGIIKLCLHNTHKVSIVQRRVNASLYYPSFVFIIPVFNSVQYGNRKHL